MVEPRDERGVEFIVGWSCAKAIFGEVGAAFFWSGLTARGGAGGETVESLRAGEESISERTGCRGNIAQPPGKSVNNCVFEGGGEKVNIDVEISWRREEAESRKGK